MSVTPTKATDKTRTAHVGSAVSDLDRSIEFCTALTGYDVATEATCRASPSVTPRTSRDRAKCA